jgi:hypothetical protein
MKKGPFKMKGFSGFGEGTNKSPVKAADESLLEASKMGSDEVAETTRQMGENLATMVSRINTDGDKKDKNKNKDKDK